MRSVLRWRVPLSFSGLLLIFLTASGCRSQRSAAPSVPIDDFIVQAMDRAGVPGLSMTILEKGRIGSTRTFGVKNRALKDPVSDRTIFEACSLSKPVFAYAVLTLVVEGKLELDRPLVSYVPEKDLEREFFHGRIADDRIRHITSRMVLSHRTGFPNWRGDEDLKLLSDPGAKFGYSGEGFVFLQTVVEKITGLSTNAFVKERVFDPLGMTDSSYVWTAEYDNLAAAPHSLLGEPETKGHPAKENAAASLHTTSQDYARFLIAVLQGSGLRDDLGRQMLTGQTAVSPGISWGLGMGLETARGGEYIWHWGDNGGFKCFFLVNQKDLSGFVYFSNGYFGLSLAEELARQLIGPGHPVFSSSVMEDYDSLDSPIFRLVKAISKNDLEAGIRAAEKAGASGAPTRTIRESSFNDLGYSLLGKKRIDDAVKVFELNVRLFPGSANVYDSLAEALEKRGDAEAAIRNYEKSLAMKPDNTHAAARIKALREKISN
jgi:CubicO group peptidase (beta-lactamase class C family)